MRLLLDTHAFLWFVNDDAHLTNTARTLISDPSNDRLLSIASVWELAIKVRTGRLVLTKPLDEFIPEHLSANRVSYLDIAPSHVMHVATMPYGTTDTIRASVS
jgi:PIN domain nuclease of toxin-antitoxin system